LRELWLTAYGYEILSAMRFGLTTDSKGFEQITTAFSEINLDLNYDKTARSGVQMSRELRESIWWIQENKGKLWMEIL